MRAALAALALTASAAAAAAHSMGAFARDSPPVLWLAGALALASVLAPSLACTYSVYARERRAYVRASQSARNACYYVSYAASATCLGVALAALALAQAIPLQLATGTYGVLAVPAALTYAASVVPFRARPRARATLASGAAKTR